MPNTKIKTIIVEDDIKSQEYLRSLVGKHCPELEISGCAKGIAGAVNLINTQKPELVFMDIELIDGLSFDIFPLVNNHEHEVIFVTAHTSYMQRAIDHYAFSYITKPIDAQKLVAAVNHYVHLKNRLFTKQKIALLNDFIRDKSSTILLQTGYDHVSVEIEDIVKCCADGNYTQFILSTGEKHLANKNLRYYNNLLMYKGFFRPNRSVLVNIKHIRSIHKKETIVLKTNESIPVSTRNKSKIQALIDMLS